MCGLVADLPGIRSDSLHPEIHQGTPVLSPVQDGGPPR